MSRSALSSSQHDVAGIESSTLKRLVLHSSLMLSRTPFGETSENEAPEDTSLVAASRAYDHQKYELAERTWRVLAERGDAEAQFRLAESYLSGPRAEELSAEAINWFTRAAEQGHPFAQNELSLIYRFGQGVAADPIEAAKWTERAAVQGVAEAQVNMGTVYARGEGVAQDSAKAQEWYARGAAAKAPRPVPVADRNDGAGSPDAVPMQHGRDRSIGKDARPTDPKQEAAAPEPGFGAKLAEASRLPETAEESHARDDVNSLFASRDQPLKELLDEIRQDEKTRHVDSASLGTLNKDRQHSDRTEQMELAGSLLSENERAGSQVSSLDEAGAPDERLETAFRRETDPDTERGLTGDDAAGAPSGPVSRYLAGEVAYREGRFEASLKIWEPLAGEGVALAQLALGNLYESGQGSARNLELAAYWYEKAAKQGLAEAHYALGLCYLFGRGVPEDKAAGLSRLQQAADLGSGYAKSVLPELERELGPVEPTSATKKPSGAAAEPAHRPVPHDRATHGSETSFLDGSSAANQGRRRPSHSRRRRSRRRIYRRIALAAAAILFLLAASAVVYFGGAGTPFN